MKKIAQIFFVGIVCIATINHSIGWFQDVRFEIAHHISSWWISSNNINATVLFLLSDSKLDACFPNYLGEMSCPRVCIPTWIIKIITWVCHFVVPIKKWIINIGLYVASEHFKLVSDMISTKNLPILSCLSGIVTTSIP